MPSPNIILILTDDQDDIGSVDTMPNLRELIADQGVRFKNSFVNTPICGASRATLMTGQAAHNHGARQNDQAYQIISATENNTLGVWMQAAGYVTGYLGKFINGYGHGESSDPLADELHIVPGWDDWQVNVSDSDDDDKGPKYYNYRMNVNGSIVEFGDNSNEYITDVLAAKAVSFIQHHGGGSPGPFFLVVAGNSPHKDPIGTAIPAPRHIGYFSETLPLRFCKRPSFNEPNVSDKSGYVQAQPVLNDEDIAFEKRRFLRRREALLATDEMVKQIYDAVVAAGVLDNTIFIFTSDNGYSLGDHRLDAKNMPYEESIRVPLIIRWPDGPVRSVNPRLVCHCDVVATILAAAGATAGRTLDGRDLRPVTLSWAYPWRTALQIDAVNEGTKKNDYTFNMIRTDRYAYIKFISENFGSKEELYDLNVDPFQMRNKIDKSRYKRVVDYLKSLANNTADCEGDTCWVTSKEPLIK